jgi:GntR family transcriptional repressor for pyruvate dehydrogenase complex
MKVFDQLTREPRLSDKVATTILEMILAEGLNVGERMPSERELSDQFGVSRTVVREAIRTLAAKGVLEARAGHGVRIVAVPARTVSESLRLFIRSGTLDYSRVAEVRQMLEIETAGLAAQRVTDKGVDLLRANVDAMERAVGEVDRMSQLDLEFHRALAETTRNELFLLLLDSIGDALLEIRRRLFADSPNGAQMHTAVRAHREILAGIAARDAEAAQRAMRAHLSQIDTAWAEFIAQADQGVGSEGPENYEASVERRGASVPREIGNQRDQRE